MRKSTRVFVLAAVIEVLLVTGALYMIHQVTTGGWQTFDQAEAVTRITTVMGAAIGAVAGVFLCIGFILRRRSE